MKADYISSKNDFNQDNFLQEKILSNQDQTISKTVIGILITKDMADEVWPRDREWPVAIDSSFVERSLFEFIPPGVDPEYPLTDRCYDSVEHSLWIKNAANGDADHAPLSLCKLAYVLSMKDDYTQLLKGMWQFCGFDSGLVADHFPRWNSGILSKDDCRAHAWFWVITRLSVPEYRSCYFEALKDQYKIQSYRLKLRKENYRNEYLVMDCFKTEMAENFFGNKKLTYPDELSPDLLIFLDEFYDSLQRIQKANPDIFNCVAMPKPLFSVNQIPELATEPEPESILENKISSEQEIERPAEKTKWEITVDRIKTNHPEEWERYKVKCMNPDNPPPKNRAHYWNREMWCKILCLEKRLANPEQFKEQKDVYNYMIVDRTLKQHLMKTDKQRKISQSEKIERNIEPEEYPLKLFKKWTHNIWPDELFKKGRKKAK